MSQRVLLQIGYQRMVLSSDAALAALLRALRGAVQVEDDRSYLREAPCIVVGEEIEIEAKILPKKCGFKVAVESGGEIDVDEPSSPGVAKARQRALKGRPTPKQLGGGPTQLLLGGPRG